MTQVQCVQQEGREGLKLLAFYFYLPLPLMIFSDALNALPKLKLKYMCHMAETQGGVGWGGE